MPPLWLIGMMGAGKSTVGRQAAELRGVEHIDIDQRIAARAGRSISQIFAEGEHVFRAMEAAEIGRVASLEDVVVSTGGGVVLDPGNVEAMRRTGAVVLLEASVEALVGRVSGRPRPLLDGHDPEQRLRELLEIRAPIYDAAAHFVVDAEQSPADVAVLVAGCDLYSVGEDTKVVIGPTLPRRLLPASAQRQQAVVVVQKGSAHVGRAVMARLESEVDAIAMVELPDREAAKTLDAMGELYAQLAELNVGRGDTVVGVGGGTVTDVAGFAAATWLRGIESVLVPTTMLGAVDAAIGGKTGINVMGKNLVGAFWHPTQVAISLGVLGALPRSLIREGAAEAIKAGFIADPRLVELYDKHGLDAPISEVVRRAVAVKTAIVADDFREAGRRVILNFGHTIGHAVEVERAMPHGHAVAVGMVAAAAISQRRHGFDSGRVVEPLEKLGLPTRVDEADLAVVRRLLSRDKKRTAEGLRMVLLRDIGDPVVEVVDSATIDHGLKAVGIS